MSRREVVAIDGDGVKEPTSWLARHKDRSERGDTMVEILLSLIVLGLTSVALLIGFSTTLSASAQHRQLASANLAINDYSQQVTAGVEADSTLFTCPTTPYTAASFMAELGIASTAPYNPHIISIQYWNPSTDQFNPVGGSCVANSSELITVGVSFGSKNQTLSFVVDSPTAGSNFVGGAPTNMGFVTPALGSNITASSGASLPVNPVVEVYYGNSPDATDLSPITLTLGDANGNPTSLGTLSGCSSNDLNGVVTYTGCTISLTTSSGSATDFTLVATTPSLASPALSGLIAVTGSTSSYLSFTTQPAAGNSGAIMTTQPIIKAYLGGTTTVDTTVMTVTLTTSGSLPGTPQLTSCAGTTNNSTTTESNGVVTITDSAGHGGIFTLTGCDFSGQFFYDVNSGAVGTPYTMTASAPNVTSATSQPFAATGYGAAAQLEFIAEPSGGSASTTSATSAALNSFQVAVEDSWGNILSGQGQAPYAGSLSIKVTGGATLSCTPTFSGGIFTFTGCSAPIGATLTLTATATGTGSTGVTPQPSTPFNVTGPVTQLVWYGSSAQPVAGASGSVMTNQPVLAYEDAGTNPGETGPVVVTSDTTSISYTASYSSGTQGTPLNGTLTTCSNLPPVNGIVAAGNCTFVGLVGTNYTMTAATTSGTLITSPASATFSPTGPGPASQLVFAPTPGVEPVPAAAGSPFTTDPVAVIEDAGGNIVSSATTQVEMNAYLVSNPTLQGGSLLNCSTLAPVNGSVSLVPVSGYLNVESSCAFGGVVGTSYELIDTAPGLTSAVSSPFTPTTFGPANAVTVSGCSSGLKWSNTCTLSAAVQDAWGNTVTNFASGITFADAGGAGSVSGLGTFTASGGVANDTVTGSLVGPDLVTATAGAIVSPQYSFNVIGDTTTATVSESPSTVTYGAEGSSIFTVTVVTGNHEVLPSTDPVTVSIGGGLATCIANVTPSGTGGSGTCSIGALALQYSATPYVVTTTYPGDAQLQASALATSGTGLTVNRDSTTLSISENPTTVTYGAEGSSIFTVTVVTGNHEVLPTTDHVIVTVGGTATCTANVTPSGTGGSGTCSVGATALPFSATPYGVTATFAADADLSSSVATSGTGLTVNRVALQITASSSTVTYGSSVPTITASYSGFVNGETSANLTTQPTCTTAYTTSSAPGTTPSTSCSGAVDANYTITYVAGTVTVNKATLQITASSSTVTYGAAVPTITPIYSGFVNGQTSASLTTQPTCTTAYTTSSAAGTTPSTSCSGAVDANYTITYVAGTVTVNKAPLQITASSSTVTYSAAVPTITPIYSGFVNSQTSAVLTTQPTCTTAYTTSSAAGTTPSTSCSGAVDANYTITYVAGTVTVNQLALTASIVATSRAYTGTNAATISSCTLNPTKAGISCSAAAATFSQIGVANGLTVTATGITLSGTGSANYSVNSTATITANITKAPLTITASSSIVTYGAAVPTITATYSGFVNGEGTGVLTTQPTCTTAYTTSSAAGTTPSTSCSGAAAANYSITNVNGTVTVNKAPLQITASSSTVTYSAAVPTITASYSGFVNSQTSAVLTTQPTCTTAYTTSSAAGTTPSTSCSGAVDANYTITYVAGTVTVNQLALTASIVATSRAYTGTNAATISSCTLNPTKAGISCSAAAATFSQIGVANGLTVTATGITLSGTGSANYSVNSTATITANITKAPLTITASSSIVTYGSSVPTILPIYSGFVNGEGSAVLTTQPTCSTAYTTSSAAGTTPSTSCSGAAAANYSITNVNGIVTVNKATPTVTVTNTVNPTGISAGNLVLTATVTGVGTTGPTGTLTWTIAGGTVATCSSTTGLTVQGSTGTSTATCTISTPAAGTYTAKAAYGGDTTYNLLSSTTFGLFIGGTNASVPTGPEYYIINSGATPTPSTTNTANTINPGSAITLTGITMTMNGNASANTQTATVGQITGGNTYTPTMSCQIAIGDLACTSNPGTFSIPSGATINMAGAGNGLHTYFWIVTYTNP